MLKKKPAKLKQHIDYLVPQSIKIIICLLCSVLYLGKLCASGNLDSYIDSHTVIMTQDYDEGKKKQNKDK